MSLIGRLNPMPGFRDFWSEFTRPQPYRWPILGVSILLTCALLYGVVKERVVGPPVEPDVTYISTFAPGRSDEEIVARNKANQLRKDERAAELAEREERRKEIYRTIGRATGLDVDEMERKIAEDKAREEAAAARDIAPASTEPQASTTPASTAPATAEAAQE